MACGSIVRLRASVAGRLWLDLEFARRALCFSIRSSCFSRRILLIARVSESIPGSYDVSRFKKRVGVLTSNRNRGFEL